MSQFRVLYAAFFALLVVAGPATAQDGPPSGSTFVYLNSAEIIQSTPGAAEAQRTFDQEIADRRAELQEEAAVVDSLVRDYQQQEELLSPQAKEDKQQEIRSRQQALQTRRLEMENELGERQQELLQPILERVSGVIEEIRAERDYAMVFDISTEGVVAADPSLDITELVKARLGSADTASAQSQP